MDLANLDHSFGVLRPSPQVSEWINLLRQAIQSIQSNQERTEERLYFANFMANQINSLIDLGVKIEPNTFSTQASYEHDEQDAKGDHFTVSNISNEVGNYNGYANFSRNWPGNGPEEEFCDISREGYWVENEEGRLEPSEDSNVSNFDVPTVRRTCNQRVSKRNKRLSPEEQIRKFRSTNCVKNLTKKYFKITSNPMKPITKRRGALSYFRENSEEKTNFRNFILHADRNTFIGSRMSAHIINDILENKTYYADFIAGPENA